MTNLEAWLKKGEVIESKATKGPWVKSTWIRGLKDGTILHFATGPQHESGNNAASAALRDAEYLEHARSSEPLMREMLTKAVGGLEELRNGLEMGHINGPFAEGYLRRIKDALASIYALVPKQSSAGAADDDAGEG